MQASFVTRTLYSQWSYSLNHSQFIMCACSLLAPRGHLSAKSMSTLDLCISPGYPSTADEALYWWSCTVGGFVYISVR